MSITPEQLKAARRLVGWSQEKIARLLGINEWTIAKFERGVRPLREADFPIIRAALESAGVVFDGDGLGVRLKKQRGGNGLIAPDDLDVSNDE